MYKFVSLGKYFWKNRKIWFTTCKSCSSKRRSWQPWSVAADHKRAFGAQRVNGLYCIIEFLMLSDFPNKIGGLLRLTVCRFIDRPMNTCAAGDLIMLLKIIIKPFLGQIIFGHWNCCFVGDCYRPSSARVECKIFVRKWSEAEAIWVLELAHVKTTTVCSPRCGQLLWNECSSTRSPISFCLTPPWKLVKLTWSADFRIHHNKRLSKIDVCSGRGTRRIMFKYCVYTEELVRGLFISWAFEIYWQNKTNSHY